MSSATFAVQKMNRTNRCSKEPLFHVEISNVNYLLKLAKLQKASSATLPHLKKCNHFRQMWLFYKTENI